MLRYVAHRLVFSIMVLLGVSVLVFSMMHLVPGDPVILMLSAMDYVTEEQIEALRVELGLADSLYVQFGRFLWNALHGDLGKSIVAKQPVLHMIWQQLPYTLELAVCSMALAIFIGLSMGTIAAWNRGTWYDTIAMFFALGGVSIPGFWLGLILILTLSVRLAWLPATGQGSPQQLLMPVVALGFGGAGVIARLTRSSMLEVLRQDYIVTARAKGLKDSVVLRRHALRNGLIPVVTTMAVQFGRLLAGTVVIETVFARQGIGNLIVVGILTKDFPVVQGTVLVTAGSYVFVNLLVDISYVFLDPRIRFGEEAGV